MAAEHLVRLLIIGMYLTISLLVFRGGLFLHLTKPAKRMAAFLLVAQVLAIALGTGMINTSLYLQKMINLNHEGNIPTTIASTQLALVCCALLMTAWHAKLKSVSLRFYLVGLALVFLFFAWDEQLNRVRKDLDNWILYYAMFGAAVGAATLAAAARADRQTRASLLIVLAGLALGAAGALLLEPFGRPSNCQELGFWHDNKCQIILLEESMEFLGMWLALVAALSLLSAAQPHPTPHSAWLLYLTPFAWIALVPTPVAFELLLLPTLCLALFAAIVLSTRATPQFRLILRCLIVLFAAFAIHSHLPAHVRFIEYHLLPMSRHIRLENGFTLRLHRIDHSETAITVHFFATPAKWRSYSGLGYSLHLVDLAGGMSVAGVDIGASRRDILPYQLLHEGKYIYKQQMTLHLKSETPANRALQLVLTVWREDGDAYVRQRIVENSDERYPVLGDTQLLLAELVLPTASLPEADEPVGVFENGLILEKVVFPLTSSLSEPLRIQFSWRSKSAISDTFSQFLHFVHVESDQWWGYDQPPLGLRLPTFLWYDGLADSESWQIPLPPDLAPGTYALYTGVYRADDLRRLAASDQAGSTFPDASIPLGTIEIGRA